MEIKDEVALLNLTQMLQQVHYAAAQKEKDAGQKQKRHYTRQMSSGLQSDLTPEKKNISDFFGKKMRIKAEDTYSNSERTGGSE